MKFFLIPLITVLICQTLKLSLQFYRKRRFSFKMLLWEGFWAGKFPSSHAAVLASSLYLLFRYTDNVPITGFAAVASFLFLYGLLEDKKRQILLETYISGSKDQELKKMVADGTLRDFNGHTLFELLAGICVGLIVTLIMDTVWI